MFAENSQIFLKHFVIPILLTFIYLVALLTVSKQPTQLIVQLNASMRHTIVTKDNMEHHQKQKVISSTPTVKKLREKKSCNWVFENGIVCRKKFHKTSNLKVHMDMHRGIKPFQCYVCGQSFRNNTSMKNHKKKHFRNDLDQADHEYIFKQSNLAINNDTNLWGVGAF